jgi:hypothetical protein
MFHQSSLVCERHRPAVHKYATAVSREADQNNENLT